MSVAIKKLEGVASVDVSLEKASADIQLKPGNRVTIQQLRQTIKKNGYPTRDAEVTATGRIAVRNGVPVLDLMNGSMLELTTNTIAAGDKVIEVTGVTRVREKGTEQFTVKTVK